MKEWFFADPISALCYIVAVPATVILILQTILLLFGLGHGEGDLDSDVSGIGDGHFAPDMHTDLDSDGVEDFHPDHGVMEGDSGLRLITVRGMVAFFAVGGWSGIAAKQLGTSSFVAVLTALLMGCAALLLVAFFFKWAMSLRHDGTLRMENALGKTGEVYLTVPAKGCGYGKVNLIVQERMVEAEAITYCDRAIKFGEKVKIIGCVDESTLVVEPLA